MLDADGAAQAAPDILDAGQNGVAVTLPTKNEVDSEANPSSPLADPEALNKSVRSVHGFTVSLYN
jgi:hypothetical protein